MQKDSSQDPFPGVLVNDSGSSSRLGTRGNTNISKKATKAQVGGVFRFDLCNGVEVPAKISGPVVEV